MAPVVVELRRGQVRRARRAAQPTTSASLPHRHRSTAFEDFVRCDVPVATTSWRGRPDHRLASPYPLRHHGTNVHVVEQRDGDAAFASYIFVTQIVEGAVANLSTGIVTGEVRFQDGSLRITRLEVVLDTQHSVPFGER